jgi:hypothetical protein
MTITARSSHRLELRKEAYTTALYVAICLLAGLIALGDDADGHVVRVIWGVTIGLALAHWFAFRVSARLVAAGEVRREDAESAAAQLAGAAVVALLASAPALVAPTSAHLEAAEFVLAAFLGLVGFAVARASGASHGRALLYAVSVLIAAVTIAVVKLVLGGH